MNFLKLKIFGINFLFEKIFVYLYKINRNIIIIEMKNLAGNKESDKFIQIELEKAKIPFEKIETTEGECH